MAYDNLHLKQCLKWSVKAANQDHTGMVYRWKAMITISLIGFMESISIAKAMAAKTRQNLSPDRELIGQRFARCGIRGLKRLVTGRFDPLATDQHLLHTHGGTPLC